MGQQFVLTSGRKNIRFPYLPNLPMQLSGVGEMRKKQCADEANEITSSAQGVQLTKSVIYDAVRMMDSGSSGSPNQQLTLSGSSGLVNPASKTVSGSSGSVQPATLATIRDAPLIGVRNSDARKPIMIIEISLTRILGCSLLCNLRKKRRANLARTTSTLWLNHLSQLLLSLLEKKRNLFRD